MIEFGMEVQQAGKTPRASHNEQGLVELEDGIVPKASADLEYMVHSTKESEAMGPFRQTGSVESFLEDPPPRKMARWRLGSAWRRDSRNTEGEWTWRIE